MSIMFGIVCIIALLCITFIITYALYVLKVEDKYKEIQEAQNDGETDGKDNM